LGSKIITMKKVLFIMAVLAVAGCANTKEQTGDYPISPVDIRNVVITDQFWLPKIKTIQDSTIQYAFKKCDEEGRMENFLIAGGKKLGKVRGKMPFDDSDLYKIIEGASYSLISNPNPMLDAYLDSIIGIIKIGQEPDGYLSTWFTIDRMSPPAPWAKPSKKRWDHEDTNHELYNSGHLFEAAAAHYLATGKRNFLDIALKNADLLVANFGPDKLKCPPGHQIVETGLIKLYHITKNKKYLDLAKFYLDQRGDSTSHKLYGEYSQDHLPVIKQTEAVGHAVRAEYMYAGMTDIAAIYHDRDYLTAINKIWENIVNKKMYLTGGVGSRHDGEAFGNNYELPNLSGYNETCAAIGSVYWNQRLFLLTGDSKYYDIIERTLYNGLISGISLSGKEFFYPNPLESDGKYDFNMGSCTRQSWFDCSCCPTNLIRFVPSLPGLIYSTNGDSLYINLYLSNHATVSVGDKEVAIVQQTGYPWNGKMSFEVNPEKKGTFTLKLRLPGWAQGTAVPSSLYSYIDKANDNFVLKVNGKEEKEVIVKGYIQLTREWENGDRIELDLPMPVREVVANEMVKDDQGKVAFEVGPMVYCAEEIDNSQPLDGVSIPEKETAKIDTGNMMNENFNKLEVNTKEGKLTLIPYYLWSNRGVGKMKVWLPLN